MSKRKVPYLLLAILTALSLVACGSEKEPGETSEEKEAQEPRDLVWVMRELDMPMSAGEYFFSFICNGKICYSSSEVDNQVVCISVPEGEESLFTVSWPEEVAQCRKILVQLTFDPAGNLYTIAHIQEEREYKAYLCKFDTQGQLVYMHNVEEQMNAVDEKGWTSKFQLEVDAQGRVYMSHDYIVLLYDEGGVYQNYIQVIVPEMVSQAGIDDMVRGRDGKVYLYYPVWGNNHLAEVDFANAGLINEQEILPGQEIAFAGEDGFIVSNDEEVYIYDTDVPMATRTPRDAFVWWDYLLNGENLRQLAVTEDGKILAIIASSKLEFCHAVLMEQMTEAEAKALEGDNVRLKRE